MDRSTKIGIAIFAVLVILMGAVYLRIDPGITRGMKAYTVRVIDDQSEASEYHGTTDQEYLEGALAELQDDGKLTYRGKDGNPGYMILEVNGLRADYQKDHAYWALYDNEDYATKGVSELPLTDGHTYTLRYEKGN